MLHAIRAEQIKLTTLRSSWWTMSLTVGVSLASALLIAANVTGTADQTVDNLATLFLVPAQLTLLAVLAMAVIVSTSEYRFGQLRMTLAATPSRWQVMLAKAAVTMAAAFCVGAATSWLCVLLAKPLLPAGYRLELSDPGALRMVWGLPLYFAVASLLALGLGAIIRNSPAAITILALVSLAVEKTLLLIPQTRHVAEYLPFTAGARITQPSGGLGITPWGGFAVCFLYAVGVFMVAMILVECRDA